MGNEGIILIIATALYIVMSIFISYVNFINRPKLHTIFKCFPLSILIITSIILLPNEYLIYIGFIFAVIGDALILCKFKNSFVFGAISFFISHIFFLIKLFLLINTANNGVFPTYLYLLIPIMVLSIDITTTLLLFKKVKFLSIPMGLYFAILFVNLLVSTVLIALSNQIIFILMFLGYIFFIVSDIFITLKEYVIQLKKHNFLIICTYYIAQILIAIPLYLTILNIV